MPWNSTNKRKQKKTKKSKLKQFIMKNSETGFHGFRLLPWLHPIIFLQYFLNWSHHFSYFWIIFFSAPVTSQWNILTNTYFVSVSNGSDGFPGFLDFFCWIKHLFYCNFFTFVPGFHLSLPKNWFPKMWFPLIYGKNNVEKHWNNITKHIKLAVHKMV